MLQSVVADAQRSQQELQYLGDTRRALLLFQSLSSQVEPDSAERRHAVAATVTGIFVSQQLWAAAAYWRAVQEQLARNTCVPASTLLWFLHRYP
jgi:hypothetical protein